MTEWPLGTTRLRFRTELFYNRLTSTAWSYAYVGTEVVATARGDRTLGVLGCSRGLPVRAPRRDAVLRAGSGGVSVPPRRRAER